MSCWKVRLVVLHFMEVREAAFALRVVLEAWIFGATAMLIAMYLLA